MELVKREELSQIAIEAGKLILKPEAEQKLLELLKYKDDLDALIEQVKLDIVAAGKKVSPDFKGVAGKYVKAYLRKTGYKYEVKDLKEAEGFVKEQVTYRPDSEEIEGFLEETGQLPPGIAKCERGESLVLQVKSVLPKLP